MHKLLIFIYFFQFLFPLQINAKKITLDNSLIDSLDGAYTVKISKKQEQADQKMNDLSICALIQYQKIETPKLGNLMEYGYFDNIFKIYIDGQLGESKFLNDCVHKLFPELLITKEMQNKRYGFLIKENHLQVYKEKNSINIPSFHKVIKNNAFNDIYTINKKMIGKHFDFSLEFPEFKRIKRSKLVTEKNKMLSYNIDNSKNCDYLEFKIIQSEKIIHQECEFTFKVYRFEQYRQIGNKLINMNTGSVQPVNFQTYQQEFGFSEGMLKKLNQLSRYCYDDIDFFLAPELGVLFFVGYDLWIFNPKNKELYIIHDKLDYFLKDYSLNKNKIVNSIFKIKNKTYIKNGSYIHEYVFKPYKNKNVNKNHISEKINIASLAKKIEFNSKHLIVANENSFIKIGSPLMDFYWLNYQQFSELMNLSTIKVNDYKEHYKMLFSEKMPPRY